MLNFGIIGGIYQQSKDSIYYRQLVPRLTEGLAKCFGTEKYRYLYYANNIQKGCGMCGWGKAGDMFLLRLESKLLWIQILERGNNYISVSFT